MAMKILVALSMLFGCSVAVPQVPPTFYAKMSVQFWNGSVLTFQSTGGYIAQNHDKNMTIICMNYTDERSSQQQTDCYMTIMRTNSSVITYIYYIKLANGTMLLCDQTNPETMDFYGLFDWVAYSKQAGKCNDACNQEAEEWKYKLSENSSLSIGVTDNDPNIPVFQKYTYVANSTKSEQQRYIYCFTDFKSETPPSGTFDIPNNCQSASRKARLLDPWSIRYKLVNHAQHWMKLNSRVRPQL